VFTKQIHVFKAGDQTSAQGIQRTFSPDDLQQVVDNYDPSVHEAPLVIGHQGDNDSVPAYGWIKGFNRKGDNLYAEVAFTDTAKNLVKDGHYRKCSISFYSPDSQINPHKGQWSARHLALLGAAPPAVKGLEPFNFAELKGVFDYAVALSPDDIFDEELGPTLIVEKSPLEMLKEKLEEVRKDVTSSVAGDLAQAEDDQTETKVNEAASSAAENTEANQMANPESSAQQYSEMKKKMGREGTEMAQQTADLEDNFPEDSFMEDGKISRKHARGANGQVMQVVENVYDEQHKESTAERKAAADRGFERKRQLKKGRKGEAHETEELMKMEDKGLSEDHAEMDYADGDENGRYETARSADGGYVDRMKTGKAGAGSNTGRFKTAKSSEQDSDRMHTAESGEQDKDRLHTAKAGHSDADGESRWAGQADGYDQAMNADQYDAGLNDYPDGNKPKMSKGTDPYGREDGATKIPVESEEMPDDEVFAVSTVNVMSDGSMRVIRQKSSDARAKSAKMHDLLYAEPEADEETGPDGVTTARKRGADYGEYDQGEIGNASLDRLRDEIGDGKKAKNKQLVPGGMDTTDEPAQVVGPDGAFAESYKGEPKSKSKQLTPGAMDEVDEPAETVGPDGAFGESSLESLREKVGDGKKSKARQLQPGEMDDLDTPAETSKRSGGVFAEEHGECGKKNPYTKTGFGSTYEEGEGDDGVDEDEEDYNELSTDHCGMNYGMGSMGQANPVGMAKDLYAELAELKDKYAQLERQHAEEKMHARREKIGSAIGMLYTEGRLTDGIMPEQELIRYCEGLEFGTLEFSEGETPATKLLNLLSNLPPMVTYGEVVAGGSFQYAEEDLDPHTKALKMVESGECSDYVEALKRTMFS
jgi:hypothetical protein